ncbi:hypothetical protein NDU88_006621 [Pleurodeles waltl]|uniref:Uncharacterized protein n=1 Tax=Pleurodeles waltl TaxID=8319 RepID=A0AAV7SQ30_PLEWA|nr:hypothetical protein NDU88_006621 [Pleurodeles waltl]
MAGPQSAGKDIRGEALTASLGEPGSARWCPWQSAVCGRHHPQSHRQRQVLMARCWAVTGASDPGQVHAQAGPLIASIAAYAKRHIPRFLRKNNHMHTLVTCGAK